MQINERYVQFQYYTLMARHCNPHTHPSMLPRLERIAALWLREKNKIDENPGKHKNALGGTP